MLAERLGNLMGNVGDSKQMSPECKQCRACCNLDSVLTTGYLSYPNERREVNLYIQLAGRDREDTSRSLGGSICCLSI
jgi:hypothetical protein